MAESGSPEIQPIVIQYMYTMPETHECNKIVKALYF
jgi:hypothetical protein